MRRQCNTNILPLKFGGTMSKHGVFITLLHHPANTVLPKNLPRWRAADSRPYELKNFEPSAKYAPCTMWYVCVGAAISRPVVSPKGKQRRRNAPTIQYRTLYGKIGRYNVKTWYFGNIAAPVRPIWFCSKICYGGGRLVAVICVIAPGDHWILIRCAEHRPYVWCVQRCRVGKKIFPPGTEYFLKSH